MAQMIEIDDYDTLSAEENEESDNETENDGEGVRDEGKDEAVGRRSGDSATRSGSERSQNSTKSLTGSIFEQYFENGRQYCNDSYYLPNDEQEHVRSTITHQAFLKILPLGQHTLARIPRNLKRILDIGTGSGEWAVAMAERFPHAEIVATDISICGFADAPPNVFFEVDDAQEDWTYTEPFDFIHMRRLTGAFRDWGHIYAAVYKHLRPGGFFEIADVGAISLVESIPDSYLSIFNGAVQTAAEKAGTPIGLNHLRKEVLEDAGLSIQRTQMHDIPLGEWSPDRGKNGPANYMLVSALEGLEASSLRLLTRELGWKADEVRDLCSKVVEELKTPGVHASIQCQFVVAIKVH